MDAMQREFNVSSITCKISQEISHSPSHHHPKPARSRCRRRINRSVPQTPGHEISLTTPFEGSDFS
jgi:hypothetical protein